MQPHSSPIGTAKGLIAAIVGCASLTALGFTVWPSPVFGDQVGESSTPMPRYTITRVGPTGGDYLPFDVNDRGKIIGGTPSFATFYVASGKLHIANPPVGASSLFLYGLNNNGDVAGDVCLNKTCSGGTRPITGHIGLNGLDTRRLPLPSRDASGAGWAINGHRDIVGFLGSIPNSYPWEALGPPMAQGVVWRHTPHGYANSAHLPLPGGVVAGYPLFPFGFDGHGDLAGVARLRSRKDIWEGIVWPRGGKPVLLPGLHRDASYRSLHNSGAVITLASAPIYHSTHHSGTASARITVVGACYVRPGLFVWGANDPCLWHVDSRNGKFTVSRPLRLDSFRGVPCGCGQAWGINSRGWIIASLGNQRNTPALLVPHGGGYRHIDLNSLIRKNSPWTLLGQCASAHFQAALGPTGINDRGQIFGAALFRGKPTGFLMTPTKGLGLGRGLLRKPAVVTNSRSDSPPLARLCETK